LTSNSEKAHRHYQTSSSGTPTGWSKIEKCTTAASTRFGGHQLKFTTNETVEASTLKKYSIFNLFFNKRKNSPLKPVFGSNTHIFGTMSLFVSSLNSGSNGNCYYIGNQDEAVLIDGGISCRETEKRMKRLGISPRKVKAIFASHEHGDHTHGIPVLSRKHQIPVYMTEGTRQNGNLEVKDHLLKILKPNVPVQVGNMTIVGFPKLHDASEPHSFIVEGSNVRIGVFTDLGKACDNVTSHFRRCHAAFLEANYDEHMLVNGRYPYMLKERIRGDHGHLSNDQALQLFMDHRPAFMTHLFLSHLSADNNRPAIVKEMFTRNAAGTTIVIASRRKETPLYHIRNLPTRTTAPAMAQATQQLVLF
jgi:phosphoribosyl 1,2-cyclic phosphodiesterase